jgi:hypothetical protein
MNDRIRAERDPDGYFSNRIRDVMLAKLEPEAVAAQKQGLEILVKNPLKPEVHLEEEKKSPQKPSKDLQMKVLQEYAATLKIDIKNII